MLFLCSLFLVIQGCLLLLSFNVVDTLGVRLNVLPEGKLSVVAFDSSDNEDNPTALLALNSQNSYHLAPFFFKPIPVNYSDKLLLMSVSGIGPNLAERLIQTRNKKGFFKSPEELLEIKGIGPARLQKLKPYLSFSNDHASK